MTDITQIQEAATEAGFESVQLCTYHPKRDELHFRLPQGGLEGDPVTKALGLVDTTRVELAHYVPLYPAPIVRVVINKPTPKASKTKAPRKAATN